MSFRAKAALLAALSIAAPSAALARTRTYLLIIGQNESLDQGVEKLQFADDDAAKNFELFSLYADRASLFSVFDVDTARLHPEAAKKAEVPDKNAILTRLDEYNATMTRDLERGDEPELFVLYAGHGDVDKTGEGYITLHDAKLSRSQLYAEIIAPSKAKFVHVVVDACKSYFLVKSRGGAWKDDSVHDERNDEAVRALLMEDTLDKFPRAGVIVATSGDQATHEWSRYRGGILSHELRSALSGAADVNGDHRIEYSEVRAFLAAANARVRNPQVRLETFARAPAIDRHRPLVDLSRMARDQSAGRLLHFGKTMEGHYSVEDDRGVRFADVNKDLGTEFDVLVPAAHGYFLRKDELEESEISASAPLFVDLEDARFSRVTLASRGAVEESFRRDLYRVPYGKRFYDGFVATSGDLPVEDAPALVAASLDDEIRAHHRLGAGYMISPSPVAEAGISHALSLRWIYSASVLNLGIAAELGYGANHGGVRAQDLKRFALLATIGFELHPLDRLGVLIDAAFGWQLLSGAVELDDKRLEGTEPRSMRAELATGLSWRFSEHIALSLRGGAAIEGLYADLAYRTEAHPFGELGIIFQP